MKDYARNNFKKENQETPKKSKEKLPNQVKRKRLILYIIFLLVILIILLLWAILPSSSEKNVTTTVPEQSDTPQPRLNNSTKSTIETSKVFQETKSDTPVSASTNQNEENSALKNEDINPVISSSGSTKIDQGSNSSQPTFTFYKDLSSQTVQSDATVNQSKKYIYTYMLQVGSYKDKKSVNAIRARLILIGLKPQVSKHGGWYRIDIGPVHSKRDGDILKHKLEASKISGSMLRQISKKEVFTEGLTTKTTP
jgi:cell division protein FtsN